MSTNRHISARNRYRIARAFDAIDRDQTRRAADKEKAVRDLANWYSVTPIEAFGFWRDWVADNEIHGAGLTRPMRPTKSETAQPGMAGDPALFCETKGPSNE